MKKVILCFILFLLLGKLMAQPGTNLPQLLPITPTAAGLIKAGMADVNKSTGAARANIPLFEVEVGNYTLPISLNYFSQGNKVEELCSRVGFNWNLAAGGVITRKVMGMPDEKADRAVYPPNITDISETTYQYLENGKTTNSTTDFLDTQPDEFFFSFNGYNGKFIIDDNGVPQIISHENIKISITKANSDIVNITMITPDGVKYIFGNDAFEKTKSSSWMKGSLIPKTSFLLDKIVLPTGAYIDFSYFSLETKSDIGLNETIVTPANSPDPSPVNVFSPCALGHFIESQNITYHTVTHYVSVLSSISTSEGVQINFNYEPFNDISNDVRLKKMFVRNQNYTTIKEFQWEYKNMSDAINKNQYQAGRNGRFYLKKLYQKFYTTVGDDILKSDSLAYTFDYYGNPDKDEVSVFAQDHYGFKNGNNKYTLIPALPAPDDFNNGTRADRSPDWNKAMQGMLQKITYPTHGTEEFFYEPNTISVKEEVKDPVNYLRQLKGIMGTQLPNTVYDYFTVYKDQNVKIILSTTESTPDCDFEGKIIHCTLTDVTTNTVVKYYAIQNTGLPLPPKVDSFPAIANHSYKLETYIYAGTYPCLNIYIELRYDKAPLSYQPVNKEAGGVRVKQIASTNALNHTKNKFFFYGTINRLDSSSGIGHLNVSYRSTSRTFECTSQDVIYCQECWHNVYSSNGVFNIFNLDNSHIYYKNIVEADDPMLANGATEHIFATPAPENLGIIKLGVPIPHPPTGLYPNFAGLLLEAKVFDKNKNLVSVQKSNYESVGTVAPIRSVYIRKQYATPILDYSTDKFAPFDVRESTYTPGWIRLQSSSTTQYNGSNSVVSTATYTYGTSQNILPQQVTTTDSKGKTIITTKKYPTDFPADPVLTAMKEKNMIVPVVEETSVVNGTETNKTKVIYQDFGALNSFQPQLVQQKQLQTGVMENKIVFSGYDNGNVTEVAKDKDSTIAYVWDYNKSLVIAEVKNARQNQTAYTSFEANGKGNFDFTGIPVADATAPTGFKAYNLSNGSISKTGLSISKTYIVSYWSKNGAQTVNTANAKTGVTKNGWTCYSYEVANPAGGTITISGTGTIDELRLYPKEAQMITYTYEPLVGITSQCDAGNRIIYYAYDHLNRLAHIYDQDKKIIKKIDYSYKDSTGKYYYNKSLSQVFVKNNCQPGYEGSQVKYTVPAGTYSSLISQADADSKAQNDINANGQAYANANGICTLACPNCSGQDKKCINGVCETGVLIVTDVWSNNYQWNCIYHYQWSDGTESPEYQSSDPTICIIY